ncbi:E3 ubiquitin-protein ligase MSL2-like [Hemiscyllium ocellatum]|uniref:E3 ubiquitin-protein ligase MSL2-like n=1 Tax=Hemiscyllium ocellatum TaxID=170820 RepID=UPI0029674FC2|nr:E3 ubiquitin-protein ligase MSL2-like [Hemiscyllium ocellatum]
MMNPMFATEIYVAACRCAMLLSANSGAEVERVRADLCRLLPYLRQSLSCAVCGNLLKNPVGPKKSACQHFVCNSCVGQKMQIRPCSWCKDHGTFVENEQLHILLTCYKKLCDYIASSAILENISEKDTSPVNLNILLEEGMMLVHKEMDSSVFKEVESSVLCCTEKATKIISKLTPLKVVQTSVNTNQPADFADASFKDRKKAVHVFTRKVYKQTILLKNHDGCNVENTEDDGVIHMPPEQIPISYMPSSEKSSFNLKKPTDSKHSIVTEKLKNMVKSYNAKYKTVKRLGNQECDSSMKSVCKKPRGKTGCKCGRAACAPSVLTCRGQRCPCYANHRSCLDCICHGCNNSYMENGTKKLESFAVPEIAHKQSRLLKSVGSSIPVDLSKQM